MDHGSHNETQFLDGLENFDQVVQTVALSEPDAILLSVGQARRLQGMQIDRKPSLMLRCDLTNAYGVPCPDYGFCQTIEEPVEQAVRLDAVAILFNLLSVLEDPPLYQQCVENICRAKPLCERYGMPLIIEPLILTLDESTGGYQISGDLSKVKALTRQAVELGADVIKSDPTDSIESYQEVLEIAGGVPLLPRGGGKVGDEEILARTSALMKAGTAGVVYGRNIFQHQNVRGIIRAIRAVVHENADVQSALQILKTGDC
jgi:DhnA family fructose-bisphosphate aldolase class Ia